MSEVETLLEKIEEAFKPDFLVAEISVDGLDTGPVLEVHGDEALSTQFRYVVECELDGPPPDLSFVIGAAAKVTIRDATGNDHVVVGIVADIVARSFDADTHRAEIVIKPKIYRQNLGRDCYAMQEVGSVDVIKEVLADYPGKIRYELTRSYPTYPYRAQYREDDWTYVSRLCEEEGIYYWFDHEGDDSTVVFADSSTSAPPIEGIPQLNFTPASSMRPDQEAVVEVSFEARMTSTKFSGKSFDPDRPLLDIQASEGDGGREHYDAPGAGPVDPSVLSFRTKNALEGAKAARSGIGGVATSARLTPGRSFVMTGHPMARFDGEFVVTTIHIDATMKRPAVTRFTAIPKSVPFRPLPVTPVAKQAGLQMGQVVGPEGQEVHPDKRGRVRTQLHWDRMGAKNETSGTWMRIDQRGAPGSMLLPRMGWNVATFNDEGGVDAPAVLCRIHDKEHPPEYDLPANMTRVVFKTATTPHDGSHNEIYFEDKAGAQEMFINASKEMNQRTRDQKSDVVNRNHTLTIGKDHELHVDNEMFQRVCQDQTIKIGGSEKLEAQKSFGKEVSGNETRSIGGSLTIDAGESMMANVAENRTLSVGSAMMEISLGEIMSHVTEDQLTIIGGAHMRVAGESVTDAFDEVSIQAVGAAKIELANTERTSNVTKTSTEIIGGGITVTTNDEFVDNADTTQTINIGAALNGKAPDVWIEAVDKIRIKCGSSTITLTKDEIRFEGTNLDLSGAKIDADTGTITHN